jgi:hypothetical protein
MLGNPRILRSFQEAKHCKNLVIYHLIKIGYVIINPKDYNFEKKINIPSSEIIDGMLFAF